MTGDVSPGTADAVDESVVYPIVFLEMDFLSAPFRFCTQVGTVHWDGKLWVGAGQMLAIDGINQTTDGGKAVSTFTLSGIAVDLIAAIYSEKWHGRRAKSWFGTLDTGFNLTGEPHRIVGGIMNVIRDEPGRETSVFELEVRTGAYKYRIAKPWKQSNEHQRTLYPNDTSGRWIANERKVRFGT